ncbi:nitroreductase family protein [Corynebacterium sp. P7202]|uniref:Nitroreductase family protein n=1 Tax=Corynebacterium pygosceleis TaxID=2800406 RepID=A0A9Q4GIH1_9CORY|nr:nitroreductase family protein [Corynebacterium pygosceleis]MCK7637264.1 nitroreductase family protein [Corynebacterium pygosceleis]MCX7445167.1 nitroreductase family protein [Corynebacterium pygosceleis]MCX7468408.1 nitroreductase family protein [Corynebacterium pygosceleis]
MSRTVADAIATRRAVRNYLPDDVPEEALDRVVHQALEAPSAFNAQARDLVVIRDPEIRRALVDASGQRQFIDAPVVLVAVGRAEVLPEDAGEILPDPVRTMAEKFNSLKTPQELREAALRDAMLVAGFALVAAAGEGLATSPTTGWNEEKVKEAIGLGGRDDRVIALVIAMGHGADTPEHPGRHDSRRVNERY